MHEVHSQRHYAKQGTMRLDPTSANKFRQTSRPRPPPPQDAELPVAQEAGFRIGAGSAPFPCNSQGQCPTDI